MTDRFPLIFDPESNKIKELPSGDNLNLQGNSIKNTLDVQADSISTGSLSVTTSSFSLNGSSLATVAITGDYYSLYNRPAVFDKNYESLNNKPSIPKIIGDLGDVESGTPENKQILVWSTASNRFEFGDIPSEISYFSNDENYIKTSDVASNYISKQQLQTLVNDSADFTEFKDKVNQL